MAKAIHNGGDDVLDKLNVLTSMDRPALAKQWERVFGCPAPRGCHSNLLRRALAWQIQMAGLDKARSWRTLQMLDRTAVSNGIQNHGQGTQLIREWQGRTHQVTVLERGFEYRGKTYPSLSAIARQITGTQWSGPQFFGVRS
jgi:hypothetical protein